MTTRRLSPRRPSKLLLPQLERAAESPNAAPPSPSDVQQQSGLVGMVKNLFGNPQRPLNEKVEDSSRASSAVPEATSKLPAATEAALAQVPDTIGAESVPAIGSDPVQDAELTNQQRIDELIALGYVDVETTGELASDLFDYFAGKFDSEHWKLNERNRDRIGRPGAACINSCIQRVMDALPDAVGNSAMEHPEWAALVLAVGTVTAPRAIKQLKLSKTKVTKKENKPTVDVETPAVGGVPVARGTFD